MVEEMEKENLAIGQEACYGDHPYADFSPGWFAEAPPKGSGISRKFYRSELRDQDNYLKEKNNMLLDLRSLSLIKQEIEPLKELEKKYAMINLQQLQGDVSKQPQDFQSRLATVKVADCSPPIKESESPKALEEKYIGVIKLEPKEDANNQPQDFKPALAAIKMDELLTITQEIKHSEELAKTLETKVKLESPEDFTQILHFSLALGEKDGPLTNNQKTGVLQKNDGMTPLTGTIKKATQAKNSTTSKSPCVNLVCKGWNGKHGISVSSYMKEVPDKLDIEKSKAKIFESRPMPNFERIHGKMARRPVVHAITVPLTPQVLKNSQAAIEKRKKRVEELDKNKAAPKLEPRPATVLKKEPFVPKKKPTVLKVSPFKLRSEVRIQERRQFTETTKQALEEKRKKMEIELKRREEERIKELRKLTQFKARPNPFK